MVWASKLGLDTQQLELLPSLLRLMIETGVDYTIFFRDLSKIPQSASALEKSFYKKVASEQSDRWQSWLDQWREMVLAANGADLEAASVRMKQVNPKYTWREWLVAPAYQQAAEGNYSLVRELQEVLSRPYDEQSAEVEAKFYRLKPMEYFDAGGISQYSCSS